MPCIVLGSIVPNSIWRPLVWDTVFHSYRLLDQRPAGALELNACWQCARAGSCGTAAAGHLRSRPSRAVLAWSCDRRCSTTRLSEAAASRLCATLLYASLMRSCSTCDPPRQLSCQLFHRRACAFRQSSSAVLAIELQVSGPILACEQSPVSNCL